MSAKVESGPCKAVSIDEQCVMQTVELNGKDWKVENDFYEALAAALGSFEGHGRNPDAFEETMIYFLYLNSVQPPYELVIRHASQEMLPFLHKFAGWIARARQDRRDDPEWGDEIEVLVNFA